jgi:hypothetical protein
MKDCKFPVRIVAVLQALGWLIELGSTLDDTYLVAFLFCDRKSFELLRPTPTQAENPWGNYDRIVSVALRFWISDDLIFGIRSVSFRCIREQSVECNTCKQALVLTNFVHDSREH